MSRCLLLADLDGINRSLLIGREFFCSDLVWLCLPSKWFPLEVQVQLLCILATDLHGISLWLYLVIYSQFLSSLYSLESWHATDYLDWLSTPIGLFSTYWLSICQLFFGRLQVVLEALIFLRSERIYIRVYVTLWQEIQKHMSKDTASYYLSVYYRVDRFSLLWLNLSIN